MIARLQQFITFGLLGLAGAWLVWALQRGQPALGLLGAGGLLTLHAGVIALEFVLARWALADDPSPRPPLAALIRAWAGETLAAPRTFCWRQPFFSRSIADRLHTTGQTAGVLLLHGFFCNRGFWNPWMRQLQAQGVPFVAPDLEPAFGDIDAYAEPIEAAVRRLEAATGRPPVIVAHSMGGLALRAWWASHGRPGRVQQAITIGSPHQGTALARFAMTRNTRQMQRQSTWLQALRARETTAPPLPLICFYSPCDNVVFPPATATMPGADNRLIPDVAHVHLAEQPQPWHALLDALQKQPQPGPAAHPH